MNSTQNKHTENVNHFDVAILGTGITGSMLGAILVRHNVRVLLIEEGIHPKFAIGESTVPQTSMMMQIIGDRFSVPEIKNCSFFPSIRQNITSSCGIKRNFGFVYHRKGEKQNPEEVTQSIISEIPHGSESHLFRQDIDAYMFYTAVRYGAVARQKTSITNLEIDEKEVRIESSQGEKFSARYLVDASGFRSLVARQFNLRETPTRLQTHSRSLFTHMVDVKPYDDCVEPHGVHDMPIPWYQGTLHHIFDGGWLWVIPFDNYSDATNPLCSVGLTLDSRRFPKTDISPEKEFREFLSNFPNIAEQFKTAKPVRDWVSTKRLQYSSVQCVGDRFCLMAHSAGFVDALFSRGLANTTQTVNALAVRLLEAVVDDDFSQERFEYVERLQQNILDYNDRLVNCSFIAFSNFNLWNAWYRIWVIGVFFGRLRLNKVHKKYLETGDPSCFADLDNSPYLGLLCPDLEGYKLLFDAAASKVEATAAGQISSDEAADHILTLLQEADFIPPLFRLGERSQRHTPLFDQDLLLGLFTWIKSSSPKEIKDLYF